MSETPPTRIDFNALLNELRLILDGVGDVKVRLQAVCKTLWERVGHYDWVGFYLVDPERERELVLGPCVGAPTEHVRIPFGRGICGKAAQSKETLVVQDVSVETNYLACSVETRSEIVVPIMKDGKLLGELDVDSHTLAPFTDADRRALETLCAWIAEAL